MESGFNSPEYKRSRRAYMAQATFEYFVTLLVADAFLAKLLTSLGISDALTGIISSFISLAFVFQLFSLFLVKTKISTKKNVMFYDSLSIFLFMILFLVPFFPVGAEFKKVLVILCVIFAYASKYVISSICFKWANSYVEPSLRAVYSANKEIVSLLSGIVFTAVFGYVVDKFESIGNLDGAFLFIAVSIFVLNVLNFISLKMIKDETAEVQSESALSMKEVIQNTFVNKNFRNVIFMECVWKFAVYFTIGFIGVYKTNDLAISLFVIQIINIAGNFARMILSRPFANYSDKRSFARGLELGIWIAALAFFVNVFTAKTTWWLIVAHTLLYNISAAGTNQNSFNIAYSYVPLSCITQAISLKNCIGGLCGFFASIIGGVVLGVIQENGVVLFGININAQQILSAVSFLLLVFVALFIHFVIAKQKVKIQ